MSESTDVDYAAVINQQAARISELEREIYCLTRELSSYQRCARMGIQPPDERYYRIAYLEGKLRRQAAAIDKMQRKGWQPGLIIREYEWEPGTRPASQRREKRHPMVVLQGT